MAQRKATGTRRVWLPAALFSVLAAGICARLVFLQVLQHDHYAQLAHEEQAASTTLLARRGSILDRNGNVLATSVDTWDLSVSARAWKDPAIAAKASERLGALLNVPAASLRDKVAGSTSVDVLIKRDLDYATGATILKEQLAGAVLHPNTDRVNPEGNLAYSMLGFIGADNTGLAGIEATYDATLQGTPGRVLFERDTTGDPIPYGHYLVKDPVPGKDIVLTIDRYLQQVAEAHLKKAISDHKAKGGSIIIVDPNTMEVLAMATSPSLQYGVPINDASQLELLRNRAVTDLYEPGSVMKVVTAAAAIDAGVVTPDSGYVDTGETKIYDATIKNWDNRVYGYQTMTGVLINSINTGAIYMERLLGNDRFLHYIDAFGFGQPSGIDLSGEATGIMRRPEDKDWTVVDTATQSFGQAISVTPIQMITAIGATINGGYLLKPHMVKAFVDSNGYRQDVQPDIRSRPITEATSAKIRGMLGQVIYPGHPAQPKLYTAGGKSGTANVPVTNGYNDVQIASFVGFAPLDNPKVLILVKIDENADLLTGAAAAGPVFAALVDEVLTYMNVQPNSARYVGAR
jgi:cell division protein FtsI/penicillin-binding protein 2